MLEGSQRHSRNQTVWNPKQSFGKKRGYERAAFAHRLQVHTLPYWQPSPVLALGGFLRICESFWGSGEWHVDGHVFPSAMAFT